MTEDFYDLLEIPPDASQDEVKEAYREKVRVYHPDVNDDDRARSQFTAVKKAHEILGDPVERQAYDRLGHKDYVAKRTSGIPSPDVWRSDSDDSSSSSSSSSSPSSSSASSTNSGSTATSSSSSTGSASSSTDSDSSRSRSSTERSTTTGSNSDSNTETSATAGAGGESTAGAETGTTGSTGSTGTTASSDGGTTTGHVGSAAAGGNARATDNAAVRWWRRQNFSLPLIWLSVLVYAAGLAHFTLENDAALDGLATELAAVGADPEGIWAVLTESRHGIPTPADFVTHVQPIVPPIDPLAWDAVLAGIVGLAVVIVLLTRWRWREDVRAPVTIDETILVALALTISTTLLGGPLLAGAVLMPLLFGVIIRRTRTRPGWKPSYLYVVPVLAPAVTLAAGVAGYASLPGDVLAYVLLPLVGALGLPLRATIRKRFGR